ncbi:stage II sporulation protein M [Clostridium sp. Marseille-Q7071]
MSLRTLSEGINRQLDEDLILYFIAILCLCIGIVLGIYGVKKLTTVEKDSIVNYITVISDSYSIKSTSYKSIFFQGVKNNIFIIFAYWGLGLTAIGIPIILILNIFKGFTIGFTFSFFISKLSNKGALLSFFGVLPQNFIYVPCIIFASVLGIKYSFSKIKNKVYYKNIDLKSNTLEYSITLLFCGLITFIGILFETFISPFLIKLML